MTDSLMTTLISSSNSSALPDLVKAIGSGFFGRQLQNYMRWMCGADYCTVYQVEPDAVSTVTCASHDGTDLADRRSSIYVTQQYWRKDPAMSEVKRGMGHANSMIVCADIGNAADRAFYDVIYPQIHSRLVIAGRERETAFALSLLRNEGAFSESDVRRISNVAELLVSIIAKHAELSLGILDPSLALTSVADIEARIGIVARLTRRETQVCARILYGLSSTGIALDLNVGTESVKTHRKRAYQRLQIGSERELLNWYLTVWRNSQERRFPSTFPPRRTSDI